MRNIMIDNKYQMDDEKRYKNEKQFLIYIFIFIETEKKMEKLMMKWKKSVGGKRRIENK